MKTTASIIAFTSLLSTAATAQMPSSPTACLTVTTVEDFNLTQYASAPWYVQQQSVNTYTPLERNRCVTAQYNLKDNSNWWDQSWWGYTVDVFNYAETTEGQSYRGNLCADYDDDMPSQLKVAPCFLPKAFAGPYWIIDYQEGTDGYALVSGGQPNTIVDGESNCGAAADTACCKTGDGINNSGLWIFTRQANPSEDLVQEVRGIAQQKGFVTSVLFDVVHDADSDAPGIDDSTRFLMQQQQRK